MLLITNLSATFTDSWGSCMRLLNYLLHRITLLIKEVMKMNSKRLTGDRGEQIINSYVDNQFTKFISFPNPKTKNRAQLADNLIWLNHDAILIEVKTRTEGKTTIEKWARSRIQEGVTQITKNYKKIQNGEVINLHNEYFNVALDNSGLTNILGLIILVHNEELSILPSESEEHIYKKDIPIQVFSIQDLENLSKEIDTLQDFLWYLLVRYKYLKINDIHTGCELEPLGYYYSNNYSFPDKKVNFSKTNYWDNYQKEYKEKITARNEENKASEWIDIIESNFTKHRKLHEGFPAGLFFIWEFGSLPRRLRTMIGKKLDSVQEWFLQDKSERKFAFQNGKTSNWHIFFFMRGNEQQIERRLNELVRLKQIAEVHINNFQYAIYGVGFKVSVLEPPTLMGLVYSTFDCDEEILNKKYSNTELKKALSIWGHGKETSLQEFPDATK